MKERRLLVIYLATIFAGLTIGMLKNQLNGSVSGTVNDLKNRDSEFDGADKRVDLGQEIEESDPVSTIQNQEFIRIPRSQWEKPFLKALKSDRTLTEEAAEYFGLSDADVNRVNEKITQFENGIKHSESQHHKGMQSKGGVFVFKFEPWNDDYDALKNELRNSMRSVFPSEDAADLFTEQAHKTIAEAYGDFGTKPKLIRVLPTGDAVGGYKVMVATGGNTDRLKLEDLYEDPALKFEGVKFQFYDLSELPEDWKKGLKN